MRFPGFTEPWRRIRLGDNCTIQMCKRIFANQTSEIGEVPFFKIGTIGGYPDTFISKELFEEYKTRYNYPSEGEVMITCAGTVGKTMQFDGIDSYFQDSNIVWIHNPNQLTVNDFLAYVLGKINWNKLNSTTITRIYNDDLRNLIYFAPENVAEQRKIVSLLRLIDERIATQRRLIEKLKTLIKGIVVFHFNNSNTKKTITIKNLGEAYSVGNLSKDDLSEYGKPCIIYGELFTTYGCVASKIQSRTNKYTQATLSKAGDILFPASTTVDAISLIAPTSLQTNGVYVAGDMFGIHILPQFNSEYISYLLNYVYNRVLSKYAQGSTIIHLHYAYIKNTTIQLPCLEEQNKCAELLEALQTKLDVAKQLIDRYQIQKSYLLQQIFI
ncbi:restriction endonuclease subunit S [uncultured Akkermansia sp.]|uniref:restriction endonuclease subunit S n=1 Tax=uncultured Akkermansia sp. TaxID=512294 RepID=UPI002598C50B|nr:restriction endonuclease subunit S [uncultured Akkermansia sp.]